MKKIIPACATFVLASVFASTAVLAHDADGSLAFLGPKGTYSEQAANYWAERADGDVNVIERDNLSDVVEAVEKNNVDQAILPVMATVSAFPVESHEAILSNEEPQFSVVGEVSLPIVSQLAVKPGTKKDDIKKILSHPNALKEASVFLKEEYLDVPLEDSASTAAAAKIVAEGDGSSAAVVGPAGAELYELEVLTDGIQDDQNNATMFWVLAPKDAEFTKQANRAAVLVDAPGGSSAFSDTVSVLQQEGFNVVFTNSLSLMGKPYAFRYVISAASEQEADSADLADKLDSVDGVTVLGLYAASDK